MLSWNLIKIIYKNNKVIKIIKVYDYDLDHRVTKVDSI